jgi:hypothetical protein
MFIKCVHTLSQPLPRIEKEAFKNYSGKSTKQNQGTNDVVTFLSEK